MEHVKFTPRGVCAMQIDYDLDENGKIDLGKFKPIIYDPSNNTYRMIGDIVGTAFKSGKEIKNRYE